MRTLNDYTNTELEEMGEPIPCECLETCVDYDQQDRPFAVCVDCGSAYPARGGRS